MTPSKATQRLFEIVGERGPVAPNETVADDLAAEILRLVQKEGVDPNVLNDAGETPLGMMASSHKKTKPYFIKVVDALVKSGANPMLFDRALEKFATCKSEEISGNMPLLVMSALTKRPGPPLLSPEGENACHVLARVSAESLDTCLAFLGGNGSLSGKDLNAPIVQWALQENSEGETAFHVALGTLSEAPQGATKKGKSVESDESIKMQLSGALHCIAWAQPVIDILALKNRAGVSVMDLVIARMEEGFVFHARYEASEVFEVMDIVNAERDARRIAAATRQTAPPAPTRRIRF